MRFHLNYTPRSGSIQIDHQHKVMLVGSCFAENIGDRMLRHHFNVLMNPNGILFNPISISQCLEYCLGNDERIHSGLLERNGIHFSFLHHSSISSVDKDTFRKELKDTQQRAHDFLKQANTLIVTFGSAFVYYHKELKMPVANCHKLPANAFEKNLLTVEEIVNEFSDLIPKLKAFNPKLNFIFTVSPVKYLKDGIEENNLSKATLLLAAHELKKRFGADYFPAYELVIDDLRDHRFFKEDLAHPNEEAINYVWEKFSEIYFPLKTRELNSELSAIISSENHKILFPESQEAKLFKENLSKKKKELSQKHAFLKF
jgi:hypothetical protein